MAAWDADRLVAEVQRLALRAMPRDELHRELADRLRRAFPVDAACWHGLDPQTTLLTTADPVELLTGGFLTPESEPVAAQAVLASEYGRDDYNSFATIARRRRPAGILSEATRGRPERSARWREFLGPRGTPYELRVAFVTRGRAWGCVVLHRSEATGDFSPAEARTVARLSRPIAEALQGSLRADAARRQDHETAPGLVLLDRHNEVELVTPPALPLLDCLRCGSPATQASVPVAVLALAALARQQARGDPAHAAPSMEVPTAAGWLALHASVPDGRGSGLVAIVIQRASAEGAVSLQLEAHGLTEREREVAGLAVKGLSTDALAEQLFLSPWTVQDHLKSIFEKTGTHSRRELRARVFYDEYLPGMIERSPLDARGSVIRRTAAS